MLVNRTNVNDEINISFYLCFSFYLLFEIPSLFCSFFVLYHLLFTRTLRQSLNTHIIIILLFLNLINQLFNIPWSLDYYRFGYVRLSTPKFCSLWVFIDESLVITQSILFAWATIERYILIFHDQWLLTRVKRLLIHYFPITGLLIYCLSYCLSVIVFAPCENTFDYTEVVCGRSLCYYETLSVAFWDLIINHLAPTIVIICSSTTLLGRILYKKHLANQQIRWRQHRKMIIQLLSISILYIILYIPNILLEFVYFCGVSEDVGQDFMIYSKYLSYYIYLLFPFICAGSLPNLKMKMKNIFLWKRRHVHAIVVPL